MVTYFVDCAVFSFRHLHKEVEWRNLFVRNRILLFEHVTSSALSRVASAFMEGQRQKSEPSTGPSQLAELAGNEAAPSAWFAHYQSVVKWDSANGRHHVPRA
jgi:hypothetical protein